MSIKMNKKDLFEKIFQQNNLEIDNINECMLLMY